MPLRPWSPSCARSSLGQPRGDRERGRTGILSIPRLRPDAVLAEHGNRELAHGAVHRESSPARAASLLQGSGNPVLEREEVLEHFMGLQTDDHIGVHIEATDLPTTIGADVHVPGPELRCTRKARAQLGELVGVEHERVDPEVPLGREVPHDPRPSVERVPAARRSHDAHVVGQESTTPEGARAVQ